MYDYRDVDYPELPYPGTRPDSAFVDLDRGGFWLDHAGGQQDWLLRRSQRPVDELLTALGEPPLVERSPILAYGSNESPGKITWLRSDLGMSGAVVAIPVWCVGLAGVWCMGTRPRDGSRPVVLAAQDGITERHTVWYATREQRQILDRCEDRGRARRLVELHHPILDETGAELSGVLAYTADPAACGPDVPAAWNRSPLLVQGTLASMYDYDQAQAAALVGEAADSDGLICTTIATDDPER